MHRAIVQHSGQAPQASGDALRMLAPVVRARGDAATAEVFEKVTAEYGPTPSAAKMRVAVADAGVTPHAGQSGRRTSLAQIEGGLTTARRYVDRLRGELTGKPLGPDARVEARRSTSVARGLVRDLEALAGPAIARTNGTTTPNEAAGGLVPSLPPPSPYLAAVERGARSEA